MMPSVDRAFLERTLCRLVQINSVNPDLVAGAPGEGEIGRYVAETLREIGLDVTVYEPRPGRVNVVGRLSGRDTGRSLILNAHMDTVAVDEMAEPFAGTLRDGRIHGRGAYDMKGSLAACLAAAKALADAGRPNHGDVIVAAVADEEYASIGTQDLVAHVRADGAIVTEPTGLDVCVAHKGFLWIEIETRGRAAHGSRYDLGVDANLRMGQVLAGLADLERLVRTGPRHALLGPGSLHAATLHGGTGLSTYAARSVLQVERRTLPGEERDEVVAQFETLLDRLRERDPAFEAELRVLLWRDAFEVSQDAPLVRAVTAEAAAVTGRTPQYVGQYAWMDSAFLSRAGIETVVFGPTGEGAHAKEEWVDVQSVADLAQSLVRTAVAYCR